jgi:dolichol-phosphate mannosyltransferase
MHGGLSVLLIAPAFNEEHKIGEVVRRAPRTAVDEILVVDDGSTDATARVARERGATVLPLRKTIGVGAAIRAGYQHALAGGYDVAVTIAGNNKDAPEEIPLLLEPIAEDRADFVQGSRYLKPGADFGRMPRYRRIATRIHPLLFSLVSGRRVTESTNGFRAVHRRVLADPRIRLDQTWLDQYELEPYLYLRAIQCGFRTTEAAVTKIYPPRHLGQTKMTPVVGWWSILRPLVFVGFGIRK